MVIQWSFDGYSMVIHAFKPLRRYDVTSLSLCTVTPWNQKVCYYKWKHLYI